jgi:hypothetical protein
LNSVVLSARLVEGVREQASTSGHQEEVVGNYREFIELLYRLDWDYGPSNFCNSPRLHIPPQSLQFADNQQIAYPSRVERRDLVFSQQSRQSEELEGEVYAAKQDRV